MPIYSENHFKHMIDLLDKGQVDDLRLIVSEEIYDSIKKNKLFKKELLENDKVKLTVTDNNLKIFLTYSEEFMSLTLFFKDGHYDDSQILIGKNEKALKWAKSLINSYETLDEKHEG